LNRKETAAEFTDISEHISPVDTFSDHVIPEVRFHVILSTMSCCSGAGTQIETKKEFEKV
jgi:hypothetical protein